MAGAAWNWGVRIQKTLKSIIEADGVALHSGARRRMRIAPAAEGAGIIFRRTDFEGDNLIPADPRLVADARLGVRLRNAAGAEVMTVEHFLAAAFFCGLTNAIVDIDGPELPIFDGSLRRQVELIGAAGLQAQDAPRRRLKVVRPNRVESGDRFVEILPAESARAEIEIDFPEAAIGRRRLAFDLDDRDVAARIICARTFCTLRDVEAMRASGRSLGGSLDNAIVVDGARILNGPLRDPDEFILHKAGDLTGDLALIGADVEGLVRAYKPGHDLNARLAAIILQEAIPVAPAARRIVKRSADIEG